MPPPRKAIDVIENQPGVFSSRADLTPGTEEYTQSRAEGLATQSSTIANVDNFTEYGVTGLKRQGGRIYEEFLPQLNQERARRVYREMSENDPTINAILFAIEMFLRKVEWRVDSASDEQSDEDNATFVRECMDDMSHTWADFISECLSMITYGWSYHEIVYKYRRGPDEEDPTFRSRYTDGKIGWRKLPIRSQDSMTEWVFDDEGGIKGMMQRPYPDFVLRDIPIEKALLFRTTSRKNSPEGRSCLRGAYRPWYFKKRMEEIEGIGVERDLAGIPMASVPAELFNSSRLEDKKTMDGFRKLVTQIRNDEQTGIIFPQAWDDNGHPLYEFKLVGTEGTRQFDTSTIIDRWDRRIAIVVLADFVFLGQQATGSYALSVSKTDMFRSALSAWLDMIAEVMNRHAIPRLFALNNMPQDKLPQIAHEEIDSPSLEMLGQFISEMTTAGWADILNDKDLRTYLLKQAKLPVPRDDTEGAENENDNDLLGQGYSDQEEDVVLLTRTGVLRIKNGQIIQQDTAVPAARVPQATDQSVKEVTAPVEAPAVPKPSNAPNMKRPSRGAPTG